MLCGDLRQAKALLWSMMSNCNLYRQSSPTTTQTQRRQSTDAKHPPTPAPDRLHERRSKQHQGRQATQEHALPPSPAIYDRFFRPVFDQKNHQQNAYLLQQLRVVRHRLLQRRRISSSVFSRHGTQKGGAIGDRRGDGANAVCRGRVRDQTFPAKPEEVAEGNGRRRAAWRVGYGSDTAA